MHEVSDVVTNRSYVVMSCIKILKSLNLKSGITYPLNLLPYKDTPLIMKSHDGTCSHYHELLNLKDDGNR